MKAPVVSIILPTYNERENIPILIDRLEQALKDTPFEVLVMDDNSPDETWAVAKSLAETRPWLRVIRRMSHRGLGPAVVDGFTAATGDFLIVMDADLQHDESVLSKFISAFDAGAELVVGSRKIDGGGIEDWSRARRFVSWTATQMARLVLPSTMTDPMSGFFGVRRELFAELKSEINPRGFKILLEIASKCKRRQIAEVGYVFRGRIHGESKLSAKVMSQYLLALYELSLGHYIPLRFVRYGMVGLSGVLVNLSGLWFGKNILEFDARTATAMGIEISIFTNFLLNNFWTFSDARIAGAKKLFLGIARFHIVCATGALINFAIAQYLNSAGQANHYFADLFGIAVATAWNYFINTRITWRT